MRTIKGFFSPERYKCWALCAAALLAVAQSSSAQSILNTNLIVNGNAEAGTAGTTPTSTVTIPGWTRGTGNVVVLPYGLSGFLLPSSPAPQDHMFNYFSAGSGTASSTLIQNIDISSAATLIGAGNIKYTAYGFLGIASEGYGPPSATMQLDFKNAGGQLFSSVVVEPPSFTNRVGLTAQQQIGLVPAGTATVTVTLTLTVSCAVGNSVNCSYGAADSLSLVLSTPGTNPATVLGANLLVNGNAEEGPSAPNGSLAQYIPGWSTTYGASVAPYGGSGWISATDPGPSDRGTNLFTGVYASQATQTISMYQDIDVSAAASLIDSGQINYQVSAWLGAVGIGAPTLTYTFFDWSGTPRAPVGQLTVTHSGTSLLSASNSAALPAGTRRVRISITFPGSDCLADNISFIIGNQAAPFVTPQGIVPVFSTATTIQPGSWVSIYGTGLANATAPWHGDFPTSLSGTSVTIDSKPVYLWFVSPTQINLQAPDDTATGTVSVVVTTTAGSFTTDVTLDQYAPSFSLFNAKYAAAIVPTPNAPGNSGNGYDYIGPAGGLPFTSRPVKAGETVLLYGVGFGPTTPPVPAGAAFSGAAPSPVLPTITIGGVKATVSFAGIIEAGLFQFNVVIPAAGSGDRALQATIGGVTTPANVFITLQ